MVLLKYLKILNTDVKITLLYQNNHDGYSNMMSNATTFDILTPFTVGYTLHNYCNDLTK